MKGRRTVANLCFFGGSALLALWLLLLLYSVFFWTGMGLRFGPLPPAGAYWTRFFRTLGFIAVVAVTTRGFITWPLVLAVGFGWYERRKINQKRV